ncbi:hypothetical protein JZO70_06780 [Enterococcus sp. 669A]|uniref:Transporter n=1 Tax=Candidatus Enterococcus moelleringii TaxID=2815325 RepID=A0ABS3L8A5_9ENTE|nr:hypothetical protein [Enterococcus sp. 669A]MBO1305856.1 hypothetical protein [Enterococcus sp. 669A]
MTILFGIAIGLTVGCFVGIILGIILRNTKYKRDRAQNAQQLKKLLQQINPYINSVTFILLGIGLIWTVYYLILGIVDTTQTEFATNVSQLIVSVLTVFSIIVAFYQFIRER